MFGPTRRGGRPSGPRDGGSGPTIRMTRAMWGAVRNISSATASLFALACFAFPCAYNKSNNNFAIVSMAWMLCAIAAS